ncbi:MAG: hypothetical protein EPN75_08725 [Beijerinckiaceae bacterium]|nr:MAG: hypothetical protein EPN75_08725 [Beijerinckiaceae bacterium]
MSTLVSGSKAWFRFAAPGFALPAAIVPSQLGWRARIAAVEEFGALRFFGKRAPETDETFAISFGEFSSSAAAVEFLSGVSEYCIGDELSESDGDSVKGIEKRLGGVIGAKNTREVYFFLADGGADPVSAARAAQVLLFECQAPSFEWHSDGAVRHSGLVPVRPDPATPGFYERKNKFDPDKPVAEAVQAEGRRRIVAPEEIEAANEVEMPEAGGSDAAGEDVGELAAEGNESDVMEDAELDASAGITEDDEALPNWLGGGIKGLPEEDGLADRIEPPNGFDVSKILAMEPDEVIDLEDEVATTRPFGILAREDPEEAVAPILSRIPIIGGVRLHVDEAKGALELSEDVVQRSFGVLTKVELAQFNARHLREAMVGILGAEIAVGKR